MFDTFGYEEARVNFKRAVLLFAVESVGIALHPLTALVIPLAVLTGGESGKAAPVLWHHNGVVYGAVGACDLHEAGYDLAGVVGKTAGVVDELVAVALAVFKFILGIDDHGVVGMADLTAPGAEEEFAVAGDGEDALCLVSAFLLALLVKIGVDGDGT